MDRFGRRVHRRIREWRLVVHHGSRLAPRRLRYNERLDVEAADKLLVTLSLIISLDVPLIPGQAATRLLELDHKKNELRIRWPPLHIHIHPLDWSQGSDLHFCAGVREAVAGLGRG